MSVSEELRGRLQGFVVSFRMGPRTQQSKECIIRFSAVNTPSKAARLIGRKIVCPLKKRKIVGKIVALHGRNGLVRARFRRGLPGQLGARVELAG